MNDLYTHIQNHLDHADQPDSLRDLFCQVFNWAVLHGSGQQIAGGGPDNEDVIAMPIAAMSGIPVFRLDWHSDTLPTVTHRRRVQAALSKVALEHLVCYVSQDGTKLAFVWARNRGEKRVELRTLSYEVETTARTTIERLAILCFSFTELEVFGDVSATTVIDRINQAFDVEAVTRQFFTSYRDHFARTEQQITGIDREARRIFTQKLFNRLMFLVFLERKGWLYFNERSDYLKALWHAHRQEHAQDPTVNFYQDRLKPLFFTGLNTLHEVNVVDINRSGVLTSRIGNVPYLNGGLFEEEDDDRNDAIQIPDEALESVITHLFYAFNFTVSESTPFDIEVAVDPEMMGKIFEELITGRHESGSYYTPRPVVAFMCREGLKGYLATALPKDSPDAIAAFVDDHKTDGLHDPESVLDALRTVRVCDPACGSGAYLLGMLQEILVLRTVLFFTNRKLDEMTAYQRKLEIIQQNLYGVDVDPFAVNISRLRLWLSLIIEFGSDTPPTLPNLEYKLESGDSLVAPDPSGGTQLGLRQEEVNRFFSLKDNYLRAHGEEKGQLRDQIKVQRQQIAQWTHGTKTIPGFDWQVEFAEVFADGGFDIVVANPPYVRQELIKELKPDLKKIYPDVYTGTADLYVYFYARALQMLKPDGMLVFISSNKWFRANYGKKLRQHLATETRIHSITDFGDLPVFGATAYPVIFVGQKSSAESSAEEETRFTSVKTLDPPYPDVLVLIQEHGEALPPEAIRGENWHLESAAAVRLLEKLRKVGTPLGDYVEGRFYRGIVTGLNEAFVVDQATRDRLIAKHASSEEVLKPYVRGRDVKRWRIESPSLWLIFTQRGITIKNYPAIYRHLLPYKKNLENRAKGNYAWYELQASPGDTERFEQPKIVIPAITRDVSYAPDTSGLYTNDKTSVCVTDDFLYLLGLLNSVILSWFIRQTAATKQSGFYEFKPMYVSQIPIHPSPPAAERKVIENLAQQCINAKGQGAKVVHWEAEINARVARLYGLTESEFKYILDSNTAMPDPARVTARTVYSDLERGMLK